jgi:hypothetical protein
VEGIGRGLICHHPNIYLEGLRKIKKTLRIAVSAPSFELVTCRIRIKSANRWTATFRPLFGDILLFPSHEESKLVKSLKPEALQNNINSRHSIVERSRAVARSKQPKLGA